MEAYRYFIELCKQAQEDCDAQQAFEAYRYLMLVFMREGTCRECATCANMIRNLDACVLDGIEALIDGSLR